MPIQTLSTPISVDRLKRRAKTIKHELHITHMSALDHASVEAGFHSFRHAQHALRTAEPSVTKPFPLTLSAYWRDRDVGEAGSESLTIQLKHPWQELIRQPQFDKSYGLNGFSLDREQGESSLGHWQNLDPQYARIRVCAAARTFMFMDATGLRPSSAYKKAFPPEYVEYGIRIPGQDHSSIWFDPHTRRYLIANEPYRKAIEFNEGKILREQQRWCDEHGYDMAEAPWPGMYFPEEKSQLYLFSNRQKGAPLSGVLKALADLPPPIMATTWSGESTFKTFKN